jgi:hypothetical protein
VLVLFEFENPAKKKFDNTTVVVGRAVSCSSLLLTKDYKPRFDSDL